MCIVTNSNPGWVSKVTQAKGDVCGRVDVLREVCEVSQVKCKMYSREDVLR